MIAATRGRVDVGVRAGGQRCSQATQRAIHSRFREPLPLDLAPLPALPLAFAAWRGTAGVVIRKRGSGHSSKHSKRNTERGTTLNVTQFEDLMNRNTPTIRFALTSLASLVALLAQANGQTSFSDGFEGVVLDPFWIPFTNLGTVTMPSTVQVHAGNYSLQLDTSGPNGSSAGKTAGIRHPFAQPQFGSISVWMYEPNASASSSNYITLWAPPFGVGTLDYNLGPAAGGSYVFAAGALGGNSTVARTTGWHHFEIASTETEATITIDGIEVYSGAGGQPFQEIQLEMHAPGWRPAWTCYWDDFAFQPDASLTFDVRVQSETLGQAGKLSLCGDDTIQCDVTSNVPSDLSVMWNVQPTSLNPSSPTYFVPAFTTNLGPSFGFTLGSMLDWPSTPNGTNGEFAARAAVSFTISASLIDAAGVVVETTSRQVRQSRLGQLRQEYVDFPATGGTPSIAEFHVGTHPLNFGDYPYALIAASASTVVANVISNAQAATPPMITTVTSAYRNPVHHANVYLRKNVSNVSAMKGWGVSGHLYGRSIDFDVLADFAFPPGGHETHQDWVRLRNLCAAPPLSLQPVNEHDWTHVHVQGLQ